MKKEILSGSITPENPDRAEKINEIFDELLSTLFQYEAEKEVYTLKKPKKDFIYHWFLNTQTKMMENFSPSVHVEVLDDFDKDSYICYVSGKTVVIKKDLLKDRVTN